MVINLKENSNIRKIDELGRIVIPRDIRKKMHLLNSDALEIYIEDGAIKLEKFSSFDGSLNEIRTFLDIASRITSNSYLVTNKDYILLSNVKEYENLVLPANIKKYLANTNNKPLSVEVLNKIYSQNEFNLTAINIDGDNEGVIIELISSNNKNDNIIRLLNAIIEKKLNNY